MPSGRGSHAVAVVGYKMFVAGGRDEQDKIVKPIDCLNLKKMEWKICLEMKAKRYNLICCGFTNKNKQFVMVAGGYYCRKWLSSSEIYDTSEEKSGKSARKYEKRTIWLLFSQVWTRNLDDGRSGCTKFSQIVRSILD